MNSALDIRFVTSNDLVFSIWWERVYRHELLAEWMWMWIVHFFTRLFTKTLSIYLRGEKYVTYKKYFIKSNRLNVHIKVEQPTSGEREIFIFAEIKFYVMRRVNTVGFVRTIWLHIFLDCLISRNIRMSVGWKTDRWWCYKRMPLCFGKHFLY